MNLLMKLLSKLFWIVLVAAIGLVYYYRADLFPQWFKAESATEQPVAGSAGTTGTTASSTVSASSSETAPGAGETPTSKPAGEVVAGNESAVHGDAQATAEAEAAAGRAVMDSAEETSAAATPPVPPSSTQGFAPVQTGSPAGSESRPFAPVPAPASTQAESQPFAPVPPAPAGTAPAQPFAPVPNAPAGPGTHVGNATQPAVPMQAPEPAAEPESPVPSVPSAAPAEGRPAEMAAVTRQQSAGNEIARSTGSTEQARTITPAQAPTGEPQAPATALRPEPGEFASGPVTETQAPAEAEIRSAPIPTESTTESAGAVKGSESPSSEQAHVTEPGTKAPTGLSETPGIPERAPEQAGMVAGTVEGENLLLQARQAFWKGDYEASVRLYRDLLQREETAELLGELGNVYFRMGRWQDAARSYARAAELFAGRGDRMQAMQLLSVVQRIDPELGRETAMRLGEPHG